MTTEVLNVQLRSQHPKQIDIHRKVLAHRRIKVHKIVEAIDISHGSVVLNGYLGMRKLFARSIPHLLKIDQKGSGPDEYLHCLVPRSQKIHETLHKVYVAQIRLR